MTTERQHTIMVVGHRQATLTMIEEALALKGYGVVLAYANEAWVEQAIAPGINFSAVVLDVGYPTDATLTALLSHLRSCWEIANHHLPPLVVLTTNPHVLHLTICQMLLKPFHLRDLYHVLELVRDDALC